MRGEARMIRAGYGGSPIVCPQDGEGLELTVSFLPVPGTGSAAKKVGPLSLVPTR